MTDIAFRRTVEDEARLVADGARVGDLFRQPDILKPGAHYHVIHFQSVVFTRV